MSTAHLAGPFFATILVLWPLALFAVLWAVKAEARRFQKRKAARRGS